MGGVVNAAHEAVLSPAFEGAAGRHATSPAVVDTGFTGFLTVTPALAVEPGLPLAGTAARRVPMAVRRHSLTRA